MRDRQPGSIDAARAAVRSIAGTTCVSVARCLLAEMLLLDGESGEADAEIDGAFAELGYGSYFCAEIRANRIRSAIALARRLPDHEAALRHIDASVALARTQGRDPDLAICLFHRSRVLSVRGDAALARASLEEAERGFSFMHMTWWLEEAARRPGAGLRWQSVEKRVGRRAARSAGTGEQGST